ncbi:MAG: FAD-dependent monooxygenase [Actinomycetota bacterium]
MSVGSGPVIAVVGAGIGGLTAAAALKAAGCEVHVFEQAPAFARVGAGIQLSANAVKTITPFGIVDALRALTVPMGTVHYRTWDTDEILTEIPVEAHEDTYGAPFFQLHRGDLHANLVTMVAPESIHLGKRLRDLRRPADGVELIFDDGTSFRADGVVGADGIHSRVLELLFEVPPPQFSGRVAYRTVFPTSLLPPGTIERTVKWCGPDRHIVIYTITRGEEVYFVTSVPEPAPTGESWSAKGDMDELRQAFEGFPDTVQTVLKGCPEAYRWGIYVRDPLPHWTDGPVALIGDACHPMTPYMAQGAGMAMEDAVVLARCVEAGPSLAAAFERYERTRHDRASRVQTTSATNPMMGKDDLTWLYGYDAWATPLADIGV